MKFSGYSNPSREEYFVYSLREVTSPELTGIKWDISKLDGYNNKYSPFAVSLLDLMKEKLKF
jgi:hypothetical protein